MTTTVRIASRVIIIEVMDAIGTAMKTTCPLKVVLLGVVCLVGTFCDWDIVGKTVTVIAFALVILCSMKSAE